MIELLLLVLTGAFAGTLGGLFGIGGGVVIVPVLYLVFMQGGADPEVATKTAIGTSLATIIVTSYRSIKAHAQRGAVNFDVLRRWGPFISLGAVLGAILARAVSGDVLLGFFAIGITGVAIQRLRGQRGAQKTISIPPLVQRILATLTGLFSALMGIGGGVIGVILLTLQGKPIHKAVATAAGFGMAIAIPGAAGFALLGLGQGEMEWAVGYVHVIAFLAVALGTLIFAPIGASLAHKLSAEKLSRVFGVYLLITAVLLLREAFFT
ncbi:sulfite exporter TauE/SafE family protein [Parvularcula sp. ZS-1/3]|uniref:Probable membrane transporter protein n=1 Tax=Parvularcula mediterranea TaxID=2732508 RepID=A0A7Y3W4N3_9PROT|nr:sulfite exporter TauE/SafE family protein [Parvularcula mediterranea]